MPVRLKVIVQKEWFSIFDCARHPNWLYIFGDNMDGYGKGGQAVIRDCRNSIGIPTKRHPANTTGDYMSDRTDERRAIIEALEAMVSYERKFITIVFPADGLGTGLAKMPEKSPELYMLIITYLRMRYGIYKEYTRRSR